jgi:hypothetical protein
MPTFDERLEVEQRLLAALLAWPRPVELDPKDFLAPAHQTLFCALQELGAALLEFPLDHRTLKQVSEVIRRFDLVHLFNSSGGVEAYLDRLLEIGGIVPSDIPDLVAIVHQCPRCGK